MKTLITTVLAAISMFAFGGTLNVKQSKNLSSSKENDGATAKDATHKSQKQFIISGELNKNEVGKCRIIVVPAFVSRDNYVSKITEYGNIGSYSYNYSYNYYETKHSGAFYVYKAARVEKIPDDVVKYKFEYLTPIATFNEEKWNYIGDTSNGYRLNGIAVYLLWEDPNTKTIKLLKKFSNTATKCPVSKMKKFPKTSDKLPNWMIETENFDNVTEELDWESSTLKFDK